jgi:hypothetical protein
MNKAGSLFSSGVMLSLALKRYYGPLRLPIRPNAFSCPYAHRLMFPLTSPYRVSSTGLVIFRRMPPLLPRRTAQAVFRCLRLCSSAFPIRPLGRRPQLTYEATSRFAFAVAYSFAVWELTTSDYSDAAPSCYRGARTIPRAGLEPTR